jgi:hypothetical protein
MKPRTNLLLAAFLALVLLTPINAVSISEDEDSVLQAPDLGEVGQQELYDAPQEDNNGNDDDNDDEPQLYVIPLKKKERSVDEARAAVAFIQQNQFVSLLQEGTTSSACTQTSARISDIEAVKMNFRNYFNSQVQRSSS